MPSFGPFGGSPFGGGSGVPPAPPPPGSTPFSTTLRAPATALGHDPSRLPVRLTVDVPIIRRLPVIFNVLAGSVVVLKRLPVIFTVAPAARRLYVTFTVVSEGLIQAAAQRHQVPTTRGLFNGQPMTLSFSVESNLDLPADKWTATTNGTAKYRNAATTDRVTLEAGFKLNGQPYRTVVIENGIVDKYSANLSRPTGASEQMEGRDSMWPLQERTVNRVFKFGTKPVTISGAEPDNVLYGSFRASEIAAMIVADVSDAEFPLTLAWQCPDYVIQDHFDAVGRGLDMLKKLVQPFCLVEARKVDVFVRNLVIHVRQRRLVERPNLGLTFSAADGLVTVVGLTKFRTPKIGRVTLVGAARPTLSLTQAAEESVIVTGG